MSPAEVQALALLSTRSEGITSIGLTEILGQNGPDVIGRLRRQGFQIKSEYLPGGLANYTLSTSASLAGGHNASLGGQRGTPGARGESAPGEASAGGSSGRGGVQSEPLAEDLQGARS